MAETTTEKTFVPDQETVRSIVKSCSNMECCSIICKSVVTIAFGYLIYKYLTRNSKKRNE